MTKELAFVAYPSFDIDLSRIIREAIASANAKPIDVHYEPWEFNDIPGNQLVSPILERIQESRFIVADITYLNLNVVYEIGFAIGCSKRCFLVRRKDTEGDRALSKDAGIFDTLGYFEYADASDLERRLTSRIDATPLSVQGTLDSKAPVYVVESPISGDAATMLTSRIKKARYRYRSFSPDEDTRLSANDAIRQVVASAGVATPLEGGSSRIAKVHNVRAMFVAGLVRGLQKPLLMLAPAGYDAPLDVRDDVKTYRFPDDIPEMVSELALEITEYQQMVNPSPVTGATILQNLRVGDPTAENEMATLANYYLRTDQYTRTINGDVNLVVGRKGAGKTALFLQIRDRTRADKRNIVVDLKPEGFQLLKLKEELLTYLSEGSLQHLVTAFWEYLILLEVAYKLLEKDRTTHKNNHEIYELYRELEATYKTNEFSDEGDFSERLLALSQNITANFKQLHSEEPSQRLTNDQVTSLLYYHDIRSLRTKISDYLEKKQSVWILFDNLDKGWSTGGVDEIDTAVLRCLIDAGRKIESNMQKSGHRFRCIVFVRNDVYEHLMQRSADYGKEMRAILDWTEPDLLREVLRLRLVNALELSPDKTGFDQAWRSLCVSHFNGEETSAYMIDRSLMRPRNLLKIFNHCRGFANNFGHAKIEDSDIEKGLRAYSQDLLMELDRELADVLPQAQDLVYRFIDAPATMSKQELITLLQDAGTANDVVAKRLEFLLYYGIIGLQMPERTYYIFDVNYDQKVLRIRVDRAGEEAVFAINPAFWPALDIRPPSRNGN
ncbi:P-loop ATPase, Sll1717 family [Cupriavidus sp. amp6]|uniref:P-loop ATPase, Sll1717 family n=1 Tax=Cupriavidus sp. amp6 TaxID=388051 RepID=UPI000407AF5C|nr:hypothetical protein [Cupriavidus sp. amp6]